MQGYYFTGPGGAYPYVDPSGCTFTTCVNADKGYYYTSNGIDSSGAPGTLCAVAPCPAIPAGKSYSTAGSCIAQTCTSMPSAGYRYVAIAPYSGCDYVSCTNAVTSGSYYSSGCTVAGCNISKCGYGSNLFGCGGNSSGTCIGVTNRAKGYYHAVAGSSAVSTCASCDIACTTLTRGGMKSVASMCSCPKEIIGLCGCSYFCMLTWLLPFGLRLLSSRR